MKKRWSLFSVLLTATVVLCALSAYRHPWTWLNECLERPDRYDGHQVDQFREPVIGYIHADGFDLLQKNGPSIRVYCDTSGLVQGEFVGIKAVFHKEGYLDRAILQVASKRRGKIVISVLPAILSVGLFFRTFRWSIKKFRLELKSNA